ncbi:hypothetical protein LINPERPRIM_LOCUS18362 [Linum perenne]
MRPFSPFTILLLILLLLPPPSSPAPYSDRRLQINRQPNRQMVNCSGMASRSHCSLNPNCKWCRSEALDDMCFRKLDAWRLPHQVFVCD